MSQGYNKIRFRERDAVVYGENNKITNKSNSFIKRIDVTPTGIYLQGSMNDLENTAYLKVFDSTPIKLSVNVFDLATEELITNSAYNGYTFTFEDEQEDQFITITNGIVNFIDLKDSGLYGNNQNGNFHYYVTAISTFDPSEDITFDIHTEIHIKTFEVEDFTVDIKDAIAGSTQIGYLLPNEMDIPNGYCNFNIPTANPSAGAPAIVFNGDIYQPLVKPTDKPWFEVLVNPGTQVGTYTYTLTDSNSGVSSTFTITVINTTE